MKLLIPATALLAAALFTAGSATRLGAAPRNRQIPVAITFADAVSHKIKSDNGLAYQHGVGGVVAYINASANGGLIFGSNTADTGGRQLQFFFDDCLLIEGCNAPFLADYQVAGFRPHPGRRMAPLWRMACQAWPSGTRGGPPSRSPSLWLPIQPTGRCA